MERKVTVIKAIKQDTKKLTRVAPYCRVSTDHSEQVASFDSQINYYKDLVEKNEDWTLVDIYSDLGISGKSIKDRPDFIKLIEDAKDDKIDLIIVKSISRFARNTRECLQTIRDLKELNVAIFFEKENINTLDEASELILTLISKVAEEEVTSLSKNVKWGVYKKMKDGTYKVSNLVYGYKRNENGDIVIDETEAELVKLVFKHYLNGYGCKVIAKKLYEDGIFYKGKHQKISDATILNMLKNESYIGKMVYGKQYMEDTYPYKKRKNKGEKPFYTIENNHEAIIDIDTFNKAQEIMANRRTKLKLDDIKSNNNTLFTSKIKCPICGYNYSSSRYVNKANEKILQWECKSMNVPEPCYAPKILTNDLIEMYQKLTNTLRKDNYMILYKFIDDLKSFVPNENSYSINEINEKIAVNKKQDHRLSVMNTEKLIDSAFYIEQKNILEQKNRQLLKDKKLLEKGNEMTKVVEKTKKIIEILEKNNNRTSLNKLEINNMIDKIVPIDHFSVKFHLKNGLTLEERINSK